MIARLTSTINIHYFLCQGDVGDAGKDGELGMAGAADIINSTLGKALGGAAGGYTTGPSQLVSLLRQRGFVKMRRPYVIIFTLSNRGNQKVQMSAVLCYILSP